MKILYSAGNRVGAGLQLYEFLKSTNHEVKVAAYSKSSQLLTHIDWTLDALFHKYSICDRVKLTELFGTYNIPLSGTKEAQILISDIDDYAPDLVICDGEGLVANIAKSMGIKLWYCSPLHLLDGIKWERNQRRYLSSLEGTRKFLYKLPIADRTLVYSPFGDVHMRPILKEGYEWVRPYYHSIEGRSERSKRIVIIRGADRISKLSKILNCIAPFDLTMFSAFSYDFSHLDTRNINCLKKYGQMLSECSWYFTTGETNHVADAIYGEVGRICITPNLEDPETLLNAILCTSYNLGDDIAQVERLGKFAVEVIEESIKNPRTNKDYLSIQNRKTLDELVGEEDA